MLCFRKFPVATKFRGKRGGFKIFRRVFFCLTLSIISVRGAGILWVSCFFRKGNPFVFRREESFSVSLLSGIEKLWIRGGDNIKSFSRKFTLPKNFVGEHLSVSISSGIENVWIRGGSIKVFRRVSKIFRRVFFASQKFPYGFSFENFLSHRDKIFCRGIL